MEPGQSLERGEAVGRFVLLGLLGRGGMGEVYAAYDPELDRKVAVKILRARSAEGDARLLREAQATAKLSHPNVVVVYDVGRHRDTVFVAMEFIDGSTVGHWMHAAARPWRETLRIFQLAGRGLAAAHELGMVHRDFKPDNVMLTKDGQVRVMDFGLARQIGEGAEAAPVAPPEAGRRDVDLDETMPLAGGASANQSSSGGILGLKLTQTGAVLGTPAYMAPEQFGAKATDARTDQFSFCVALYEALYGERPFAGDTMVSLITSVVEGVVRPPPATKARVPGWIRRVLLRGLATDPAARFPSMAALLAALENDPAVRHRRWAAGGLALTAAAVIAFAATRAGTGARAVCAGGPARLAGVWEPGGAPSPRREATHAAFLATGKGYAAQTFVATARLLDDWVDRWTAMYRDACEATQVRGEQSAEVLDLRMTCLTERLGNLRALADVFAKADEGVVVNAVSAAGALPPLDRCADVAQLREVVQPPSDPRTRQRVAALSEELARAIALRDSGRCTAAEERMRPLIKAVRDTNYLPLLGRTLFAAGELGNECSDPSVSMTRQREAFAAALSARDDKLAAEAASGLITFAGNRLGNLQLAREWIVIARAMLQRVGGDGRIEGLLLSGEANALVLEHKADDAVAKAREAQQVTMKALGPNHFRSVVGWMNVGDALAQAGRYAEALDANVKARAEVERVFGPDHPMNAAVWNNTCEDLNRLGRHPEARPACERALTIWRAAGTDAAILSYGLTGVGTALLGEGRPAEAIAPLEEAERSRATAHLPGSLLGETRFALARALWSRPAERPRALALARNARADSGADAKAVAAIDAWLARPAAR